MTKVSRQQYSVVGITLYEETKFHLSFLSPHHMQHSHSINKIRLKAVASDGTLVTFSFENPIRIA